ncbi:MAG: DUF1570 domain-containing protein [Planctomycetota bacterium]
MLATASAAWAQGFRTYENDEHGFKLKVPKWLEEQPLEPLEEQMLAKWIGRRRAKTEQGTREVELTMLVCRIRTAGLADDKDSAPPSEQELKRRRLNGGTTIQEFLGRRKWVNTKRLRNKQKRPVKTKMGGKFDIFEVSSNRGQALAIRGFTKQDNGEIFGLFALGVPGVDAFAKEIEASAKSLDRFEIAAEANASGGDIDYEGSNLRGVEKRRNVRRDLVAGWQAHDTENFILVTNVKSKKVVDNALADLEIMRKAYVDAFPSDAAMDAVSVVRICDGREDYRRYGAPRGTLGYWNHLDEELVLFNPSKRAKRISRWLSTEGVLYHEAMHQYLHYSNGQAPPASWFNEGFGEVFGGAKVDRRKEEIRSIGKNKFRLAWAKEVQKSKRWPDLGSMLRMTKAEFYSEPGQNYAAGWAFCYFLYQESQKKRGRRDDWAAIPGDYLANLRAAAEAKRKELPDSAPTDWISAFADEIQEQAYEQTFADVDLAELEKAWIAFLKKL